jgi:hypothetical protein
VLLERSNADRAHLRSRTSAVTSGKDEQGQIRGKRRRRTRVHDGQSRLRQRMRQIALE